MPEIATATVKVVPDFSAFRTATNEDITARIAVDFPQHTIAEIQDLAKAVTDHFNCFPKD